MVDLTLIQKQNPKTGYFHKISKANRTRLVLAAAKGDAWLCPNDGRSSKSNTIMEDRATRLMTLRAHEGKQIFATRNLSTYVDLMTVEVCSIEH